MNTVLLGKKETGSIVSKIISRGMVDFHYEMLNPNNLPLLHCTAWLTPKIQYHLNVKRCRFNEPLQYRRFSLDDLLDSTEGWSINDKDKMLPRIDTVECAIVHRRRNNELIFSKTHWWNRFFRIMSN